MIYIYKKTNEELERENSLYKFGAAVVKGIPIKACPTYLMESDGTKVDTRDLTEEQIINIIINDLRDFLHLMVLIKSMLGLDLILLSLLMLSKILGNLHTML